MAVSRAELVAEILYQLKMIEKLTTFSELAVQIGFRSGPGNKSVSNCLENVKRDWPHLQWWRIVPDDGQVESESEMAGLLTANGYELEKVRGQKTIVAIMNFTNHRCAWDADDAVLV